MIYCCPNCFKKDVFLQEQIKRLSKENKKCDCCGAGKKTTITIQEFATKFIEPLVDELYIETDDCSVGRPLAKLLKTDFCFLDNLSDTHINEILSELTNCDIKKLFVKSIDDKLVKNWEAFKNEFKLNNRFFPSINIASNTFRNILNYLTLDTKQIPKQVYRARISHNNKIIPKNQMGVPPPEKSISGRANPIGISYLYTASNIQTAIAELRPHKQHNITVATIGVDNFVKLADLRNPKLSISPFKVMGDNFTENIENIHFLEHLSTELVKPILPKDSNLEYLPTQYLCELIKSYGFDGVIYKSSVGDGDNYAFFSSYKLKFKRVNMFCVENVNYSIETIPKNIN